MYTWRQCPKAWYYSYVVGIKKKQSNKRFFELGTYFHELMHVYYQAVEQGHKPGSDFLVNYMNSRIKRDMDSLTEENVGIVGQVSKMAAQYVASYSPIIDKNIKVVGVELHNKVEVTTPAGNDVVLNCITDLLYETQDGKLTVRDHKTGQSGGWSQIMIPLENQLLFNAVAIWLDSGVMPLRVEISFINSYNYVKKQPTLTERFQKFVHVHNPHAIEFYYKEMLKLMDRMIEDEDPVHYYSKDCSKCQFNAICTQELRGFDTESLIHSQYEKVDRDYEVGLKLRPRTVEAGESPPTDSNNFTLRLNL